MKLFRQELNCNYVLVNRQTGIIYVMIEMYSIRILFLANECNKLFLGNILEYEPHLAYLGILK